MTEIHPDLGDDVFVNGRRVTGVIWADEQNGVLERFRFYGDRPNERLYGAIDIRMRVHEIPDAARDPEGYAAYCAFRDRNMNAPVREMGSEIQTYLGEYFNYDNLAANEFNALDIAQALSMSCRYAGFPLDFYSNAQHSVEGSIEIEKETGDPELARQFLLHDAHEPYAGGDMASPLKRRFPEFKKFEVEVAGVLRRYFGLPAELDPRVKDMDNRMMSTEKRDLMNHCDRWAFTLDHKPLDRILTPWTIPEARDRFMARFEELF